VNERGANTALFLVGLLFFVSAMSGAVMAPEIFGNAVYIIHAEIWALAIAISAGVVILGQVFAKWYGPALRIAGNVVMLCVFGAFAYLSRQAVFGDLLVAFSAVYFVPQCAVFIYKAALDLWRIEWV